MSLNELGELIEYQEARRGAREMDPVEGRFMSLLSEEKNNECERVANVAGEATVCDMVQKKCSRASASFLPVRLLCSLRSPRRSGATVKKVNIQ